MTSERAKLIMLLNEGKLQLDKDKKLTTLAQIEEILLYQNKGNELLTAFLPSILNFHVDTAPQVRKFIAGFIEKSCKRDLTGMYTLIMSKLLV